MVKCEMATQYAQRLHVQLDGSMLELGFGAIIFNTPFKEYIYSPTTNKLRVVCNGHYETFKDGANKLEEEVDFKGVEVSIDTSTDYLDMKSWATAG